MSHMYVADARSRSAYRPRALSPELQAKLDRILARQANRDRLAGYGPASPELKPSSSTASLSTAAHQSAAANIAGRRGSLPRSARCASIWTNWRPSR